MREELKSYCEILKKIKNEKEKMLMCENDPEYIMNWPDNRYSLYVDAISVSRLYKEIPWEIKSKVFDITILIKIESAYESYLSTFTKVVSIYPREIRGRSNMEYNVIRCTIEEINQIIKIVSNALDSVT